MTITYVYILRPWIITCHMLLSLLYVTPVKERADVAASMDIFSCDFTFSLLFICILFSSRMGCILNLLWNAEMNSLPRSEIHCFQNICIAFTWYLLTRHALADQNDYVGNAHSMPMLRGLSCILSLLLNLLAFIKTRLPQFSSRN